MALGIHEQRIVIENEIFDAPATVPVVNFFHYLFRIAIAAVGIQHLRRAIGASERAALGCDQRNIAQLALKVEGRVRVGVQIVGIELCARVISSKFSDQFQQHVFGRALEDQIGTGRLAGVIVAKRRIDASENQGYIR